MRRSSRPTPPSTFLHVKYFLRVSSITVHPLSHSRPLTTYSLGCPFSPNYLPSPLQFSASSSPSRPVSKLLPSHPTGRHTRSEYSPLCSPYTMTPNVARLTYWYLTIGNSTIEPTIVSKSPRHWKEWPCWLLPRRKRWTEELEWEVIRDFALTVKETISFRITRRKSQGTYGGNNLPHKCRAIHHKNYDPAGNSRNCRRQIEALRPDWQVEFRA